MDLRTRLKLEQLKLEYDHAERLVKNVLWFTSLVIVIMLTGVLAKQIDFQTALVMILVFGIIIAVILVPVAKRTDEITKMEMPSLMRRKRK